jgi:hypothetical protein
MRYGGRALLVDTHQPAVANDIGRKNGGESSLNSLAGQKCHVPVDAMRRILSYAV